MGEGLHARIIREREERGLDTAPGTEYGEESVYERAEREEKERLEKWRRRREEGHGGEG